MNSSSEMEKKPFKNKANMTTSRYQLLKTFPDFKQEKDTRSMDEICQSDTTTFSLQVQQKFLKEYMRKYPDWARLILYHQIGSGKTCSAITIAEEFLDQPAESSKKVTIILPARLRTNFLDELISPCGMERYMSKNTFITYHDPTTSQTKKKQIRKAFMAAIQSRYDIMSFEKFKSQAAKASNLQDWLYSFTHNRLIIIDEVHNLLNTQYKEDTLKSLFEQHEIPPRAKAINTLLFRYMTKFADPSCKMVFMTATPIFDNISQLKELVLGVSPHVEFKKTPKLSEAIEHLRGKVSYFPGTSINAYPTVSYKTHDVPLSSHQISLTQKVLDNDTDDSKESFMSKQRQIALAAAKPSTTIKDMGKYAPKVKELLKQLEAPGKHVVFSNFIKSGLHVVAQALEKNGWISLEKAEEMQRKLDSSRYALRRRPQMSKVYALWDGSIDDMQKQKIKSLANSRANIDGSLLKVILGSPSIKEGVSFKHVQHLHMLDPVWNQSAKTQVEGRAIRFCSHIDIDRKSPLKRHVMVHLYKATASNHDLPNGTCDMIIYDKIIPNKYKFVKQGEDALKNIAIDHYLFRKMYRTTPLTTPDATPTDKSPIHLSEDIGLHKKPVKGIKSTTCPKPRRPDSMNNCQAGYELRKNKHDDPCCYRTKASKPPKDQRCPSGRTPPCQPGFKVKPNKNGIPCCYKIRSTAYKKK